MERSSLWTYVHVLMVIHILYYLSDDIPLGQNCNARFSHDNQCNK